MPKLSSFKITKKSVDALPTDKDAVYFDLELKGFGVRTKPNGKKTYLVQYRNEGGRTRKVSIGQHGAVTAEEARNEAKKLLGKVAAGHDPSEERDETRKAMTVKQLCDDYVTAVSKGLILGKRGLPKKASTFNVDKGRINRHIVPLLGNRKVRDLTTPDINKFQRDVTSGKTAADVKTKTRGRAIVEGGRGTATRTVGLLGGILSYAVSEGIIAHNPCRGVKRAADGKRKVRLSPEQYKALGDALRRAEHAGEPWQATVAVWALALTGCRKGEIAGLKIHEVDVAGNALRLEDSKTGASVRPLGTAAIEVLRPRIGNTPYVFRSMASGDHPYSGLPKAWKRILAYVDPESGIDLSALTLHGLRHAYASVAGDLGYTEITIAGLIGHSTASVTGGYIHALDSALIGAADRVAAKIKNDMDGIR